ncbi:hypothetical protein KSS87_005718, partial [Heliosperma pusillum]
AECSQDEREDETDKTRSELRRRMVARLVDAQIKRVVKTFQAAHFAV